MTRERSGIDLAKESERPVILLGTGGHARVVLEMLRVTSRRVIGCLTPVKELWGSEFEGIPILGDDAVLDRYLPEGVAIANGIGSIGDVTKRRRAFEKVKGKRGSLVTIIHPSAIVVPGIVLGEGVQIMAGAVIQKGCIIGMNTIINTGVIMDHDCRIGDHAHLAPGVVLSGDVNIGSGAHIGTAAAVIQGVTIGESATVGAGAVVVGNIPPNVKVLGVPAKVVTK